MCPADKDGSNIEIICKKLYVEKNLHELESTPTHEKVNSTEDEIVDERIQFCKRFKKESTAHVSNLPNIYMMPKFHKNPISFLFISASIGSS